MKFIVFEGIDGSGKSTLIQHLTQKLDSLEQKITVTREPGGTPLSEEIREMIIRVNGETPSPRTELLLYQAARAQHVDKVIKPSLEKGEWVICDRFTASSLAFQAGGRLLNEANIEWLNDFATNGLAPDLTILLDLSIDQAKKRRSQRYNNSDEEEDRFEREKDEFHERVRLHYLKQAENFPQSWVVLDASHSPDELFASLFKIIEEKSWLA